MDKGNIKSYKNHFWYGFNNKIVAKALLASPSDSLPLVQLKTV